MQPGGAALRSICCASRSRRARAGREMFAVLPRFDAPVYIRRPRPVSSNDRTRSERAQAALDQLGQLSLRNQSLDALLKQVADLSKTVMPGEPEASIFIMVEDRPRRAPRALLEPGRAPADDPPRRPRPRPPDGRGPPPPAARTLLPSVDTG